MRIKEIINESLSRIAYHYTNTRAALKILKTGKFELSSSLGSVEQQYMPKDKPYFLSTTRTRLGGYHDYIGSSAVMFVLDGNWFNNNYESRPVDYWENRSPEKSHHKAHEAEDRVFSREPTIPIDGVTAIHVYRKMPSGVELSEEDQYLNAVVRQILILAKTHGIKSYFYTDERAWRNFDTRRLGDVSILKGQEKTGGYISTHKGYLLPWIEVMFAKSQSQLSDKGKQILRSVTGPEYYKKDAASGLNNELSNARKPNTGPSREQAVKIIQYMRDNKLGTVQDLVNHLGQKWSNVNEETELNDSFTDAIQNWQEMYNPEQAARTILQDKKSEPFKTAPAVTTLYRAITSLKPAKGVVVPYSTTKEGAEFFAQSLDINTTWYVVGKKFNPSDFVLDFTSMIQDYGLVGERDENETEIWMKPTPYYTTPTKEEIIGKFET